MRYVLAATMLVPAALALSCRSSSTTSTDPTPSPVVTPSGPSLEDPRTWARLDSVTFGCLLEKAGATVEPAYRCGAPEAPEGSVCGDDAAVKAYYAGPEFPTALYGKIGGPAVENVLIEWEHAKLRMVMIGYARGVTREAIVARYPIAPRNETIRGDEVTQCAKDSLCRVVTGFEHMGGADVDCSATPEP